MKKKTYNVALNHLADLSSEELKKMRGYRNTGFNAKQLYVPHVKDIPSFINWRIRGNPYFKTICFMCLLKFVGKSFSICTNKM